MIKIVADDKIPFLKGALESFAKIVYLPGKSISKDDLADADALLIRTRTKCTASLLEGTSVKFIATATIGFDHIDTEWCDRNNIFWTNAPGCNSSSVEQYIVSALLKLSLRKNYVLAGKTIGIIGEGNVGSKVRKISEVLGMKVLVNDPPRERKEGSLGFVPLRRIMKEADIISFHVPLNMDGEDKTYHMAGKEFFSSLEKPLVLFNSSRGEVVDESALLDAYQQGKILFSVLDVWENEPQINKLLMDKVDIASPHIAGYSTDGKVRGTRMAVESLARFFNLDLKGWEPGPVPDVAVKNLVIDCTGLRMIEILDEVYNYTYDISTDDELFRKNYPEFEKLRGEYRVRREASGFSVRLNNNPFEELKEILEGLGFSVIETDCFC